MALADHCISSKRKACDVQLLATTYSKCISLNHCHLAALSPKQCALLSIEVGNNLRLTIANVVHPSFLVAVSVKLAKSKLLVEDIGNLNPLVKPFDNGLK